MKPLDRLTVPNAAAWASWLLDNGATSKGVLLTLAKKSTKVPTSLTRNEAVEEAISHGWIDGQSHTVNDKTYMQRYTPRAAKSIWSQRNVGLVERLEAEGRMQDAGRAAVGSAKQDGRWQRAYSGTANLDEMQDLLDAINKSPVALAAWNDLNHGHRSRVYLRLSALKTEAGRAKHIRDYVIKLERGEVGEVGKPGGSASAVSQSSEKSRKRAFAEEEGGTADEDGAQPLALKTTRSGRQVRPRSS